MEFKKYSKIHNSYDKKLLNKFLTFVPKHMEWIVMEKVHGANFSFLINQEDGAVYCAKRTSILADDEKFLEFQKIRDKYQDSIKALYQHLKRLYPTLELLQVYGEFYGDIYPGFEMNYAPVQNEIYYSPEKDFIGFDIGLELGKEGERKYLNYDEVMKYLQLVGIPFSKVLYRGSLQSCLKLDPKFESQIYLRHSGLKKMKENWAEGYVIKPLENFYMPNGSRVILKMKNDKYSERNFGRPKITWKTPLEEGILNQTQKELVDQGLSYVNKNRLNNVCSKLNENERKNINLLAGLLVKDAYADFLEDRPNVALTPKEKKLVKKYMQKEAVKIIKAQS